jgi:ribose transport system permease protein
MMALTSVIGASLMRDQGAEVTVAVAVGVMVLGLLLGAINGTLIVWTRVPDIIVTLAMLFVWSGAALLVLRTPGGAAADWLRDLVRGSVLSEWIPKAFVVLFVLVAIVWLPVRRTRLGLSLYAIGSNSLAAFRSGVSVSRTKIAAYALGGFFSAAAGLSLAANTGNATPVPGPYTLLSVAAVVLGGVSLAGGRGGILGPIIAVFILDLIRSDLTFLGMDPNYAVVAQGLIIVGVVMIGSLIQFRKARV